MNRLAMKMLLGDQTKAVGLLIGITFTAFLITFSMGYFSGFMTRGFALISENQNADVWVMDPAVNSTEMTSHFSLSTLNQIKNIPGVVQAEPLLLEDITVRFANGRFQNFQMIGVDPITLTGMPSPIIGDDKQVRAYKRVMVDSGGTSDKLLTPIQLKDQWPADGAHLDASMRNLYPGDIVQANEQRLTVAAVSRTIGRFPPRPLLYTTLDNANIIVPTSQNKTTFILVKVADGVSPNSIVDTINKNTYLKARTTEDFKRDTVLWYLINSEDVGDMASMLILAIMVGFGVTGILLFMFIYEHLKQFATLKALGAHNDQLKQMVFFQSLTLSLIALGLGIGLCAVVGTSLAIWFEYPFRMTWFSPAIAILGVLSISYIAAWISIRPLLKMSPGLVFVGR
ncbi:MAG TPA: ABC transporter permease [Thiomicrospira sp.]|nr:ABC transporter permease [Thiomicrospira sp.]